jgi:hypothetical protein
MLLAVDYITDFAPEIVLVWPSGQAAPQAFVDVLRRAFVPNRALLGAAEGTGIDELAALAPVAAGKTTLAGEAAAYVCERGACRLPTADAAVLGEQLSERVRR